MYAFAQPAEAVLLATGAAEGDDAWPAARESIAEILVNNNTTQVP